MLVWFEPVAPVDLGLDVLGLVDNDRIRQAPFERRFVQLVLP